MSHKSSNISDRNSNAFHQADSLAWQNAVRFVEFVQTSQDKRVMYRDIRPITDLKQMLQTSVELYADRPAFHVKDRHGEPYRPITYNQAKQDVDALGTALMALGLAGKKVAIIGENSYQWAISYLAVVCGVGVVTPLDKELAKEELQQLLVAADVEGIIYSSKYEQMFREMRCGGETALRILINMDKSESSGDGEVLALKTVIADGRARLQTGDRCYQDAVIDAEAMSVLLFTSGTTGIAKGVMLSHKNICADLMASPTLLHVSPDDVFFSVLPLHHTYECTCGFLMPLYRGASVAYCEGLRYIVKNLTEARPTIFLVVPLIVENLYRKIWQNVKKSGKEKTLRRAISWNRFTKKIGIDLSNVFFKAIKELFGGRMKVIICGGAAIDPDLLQGIRDFGINALQGYGLTECSPICALNPDRYQKNASAGYIPPGFDIRIDQPDPETGIGEICVKGDNVMLGYYNNPVATHEVLKDGWFYTGDLGYLDEDRYVYITGRIKNVIITKNGKNVFPEELEYYLHKIPYVKECMVWGKESESGEVLIMAEIRVAEEEIAHRLGESFTEEEVKKLLWEEVDQINAQQPLFKQIKRIELRKEEFKKTTGQKIKRFEESNKTKGGAK